MMNVLMRVGEDAVFADLGTNAQDYPKLQTTW